MPRKLTYKALQSSKSTAAQHKLHPNSRRAKQFNRVDLRTKVRKALYGGLSSC